MVTSDQGVVHFKHQVMEEVARLAWNNELDEEHKEALVYKLLPGPKPTWRCCIYKER